MAETTCPNCGKHLDGHMTRDGQSPKPGDCSICVYCGGIGIFAEGGTIKTPSDRDMARFMKSPIGEQIMFMRAMIARDQPGVNHDRRYRKINDRSN